MAAESAFEKKHVEPTVENNLSGLLDQMNLPPGIVEFVRTHQKIINIGLIVLVLVVVVWSLYGSYREKQINQASSALSLAMSEPADMKVAALEKVKEEYSSTDSATWAQVELAHLDMAQGNYMEAVTKYSQIRDDLSETNPLHPLVSLAIAQAFESQKEYDKSYKEYEAVKNVGGFQAVATLGMARIYEAQQKYTEALGVYEDYQTSFEGASLNNSIKVFVEEKIARIKAMQ